MQSLVDKIGLNEKQANVYLSVLKIGQSSMTEIAQNTQLKRPTCYLIVDELIILGLLKQSIKGKRKYYSAVHPRRLVEIAHRNEQNLHDVLPELLALHSAPKNKPSVHVYEFNYDEGVQEFLTDLYISLKNGAEALFFTDVGALKLFPHSVSLYKKMLKELKNPKIRELNYGNKEGIAWSKEIKPYLSKNHFVKILPMDYSYEGTDMLIFDDKVILCSLKKTTFIASIASQEIANAHRALFEWAWKAGNEL